MSKKNLNRKFKNKYRDKGLNKPDCIYSAGKIIYKRLYGKKCPISVNEYETSIANGVSAWDIFSIPFESLKEELEVMLKKLDARLRETINKSDETWKTKRLKKK